MDTGASSRSIDILKNGNTAQNYSQEDYVPETLKKSGLGRKKSHTQNFAPPLDKRAEKKVRNLIAKCGVAIVTAPNATAAWAAGQN